MPDYQTIDYRLRCHTKRTDLPVDVLRDIGEAYAEIQRLQRILADIKQGFEGCCNACEPVGEMNKKLREELDARIAMCDMRSEKIGELANERDEARREVCDLKTFNFDDTITAHCYADLRKWDCFKKKTLKDCFKENTND